MTTRAPGAVALVLGLGIVVAGCSSGAPATTVGSAPPAPVGSPSPVESATPVATATAVVSASPTESAAPSLALVSPVVGVVVAVDSKGLTKVSSFALRTREGQVVTLRIAAPLENAAEFPLGHLHEHVQTASPIRCWLRPVGTDLVVYRIEDAG